MRTVGERVFAFVALIVPTALAVVLVWFAAARCLPDTKPGCPLADLEGTTKGLVFLGVMLAVGGLLALAFSSLDRIMGIGTAAPANNHGKRRM